ncbi:MAG: hypothetical protein FWD60_14190, partial [Candidatus Azobacteroides sp.]|nr:hypothetical protein [Candidatus Azobacteroides sp.]
MKHIFLFLAALLASLCMSVAKTTYTYKLVRTDFYSKEPYVYPNKNGTYYFTIVLNPTPPNGTSGIGNYNLTVENGKFQYTGNNAWNGVAEGANIEVIFDDVSTQYGIIKIATAQSKDTANVLQAGDTIQRSYAIASLKGKTPDITLSNSNPSMGSIQPITVISLNDMEFQGIYISNGFGGSTTLKVEDYEWILPSGWQTSKGNKGTFTLNVSDSKNISIIPDLFTIGEFKVRGMNTLKSAGSDYKTFTMDRGFRFTSYPTSITFGDNTTRTFSVAAFPGLAYEWSVPAGWQINSGQGTNTVSITPGFCSVPN